MRAAEVGRIVLVGVLTVEPGLFELCAADARAEVTLRAVEVHEVLQPLLLQVGEGGVVPVEVIVEAVVGDQRALEGSYGFGVVVEGQRVGVIGESSAELGLVTGLTQTCDHLVTVLERHFQRIEDRDLRLLLQGGGTTIPELDELEAGIEHGRRVTAAKFTVAAQGQRRAVDAGAIVRQKMTVGAGIVSFCGERLLVEDAFTQRNELGGVVLRAGHGGGQRTHQSEGGEAQHVHGLGWRGGWRVSGRIGGQRCAWRQRRREGWRCNRGLGSTTGEDR